MPPRIGVGLPEIAASTLRLARQSGVTGAHAPATPQVAAARTR